LEMRKKIRGEPDAGNSGYTSEENRHARALIAKEAAEILKKKMVPYSKQKSFI
jgi:hypothetical protein